MKKAMLATRSRDSHDDLLTQEELAARLKVGLRTLVRLQHGGAVPFIVLGKPWIVAHRRNHAPWLITMRAEFFFDLLREFQPAQLTPRRDDATDFRRDAEKDSRDGCATNNTEQPKQNV